MKVGQDDEHQEADDPGQRDEPNPPRVAFTLGVMHATPEQQRQARQDQKTAEAATGLPSPTQDEAQQLEGESEPDTYIRLGFVLG